MTSRRQAITHLSALTRELTDAKFLELKFWLFSTLGGTSTCEEACRDMAPNDIKNVVVRRQGRPTTFASPFGGYGRPIDAPSYGGGGSAYGARRPRPIAIEGRRQAAGSVTGSRARRRARGLSRSPNPGHPIGPPPPRLPAQLVAVGPPSARAPNLTRGQLLLLHS
ncbi:hypothetical protein ACP4OV_016271 [Aristida adscensionis]